MSSVFFRSSLLQFAGIVGAGIFALPYVFYQSSFLFTTLIFLIIALILVWVDRFYADIILSTKGDHQLPGYAGIYLGSRFKVLSSLNLFLLSLGALTAYVKLSLDSLQLFFPSLGQTQLFIYYFIFLFIFFNFRFFQFFSKYLPAIFIFLTLLLWLLGQQLATGFINPNPPTLNFFGALVFSLTGFTIIPEVEEALRVGKRRHQLKSALLFGTILIVIVYLLFSYSSIRLLAPAMSPNLITGALRVSPVLAKFLSIFVLTSTFISSLNFLTVLREFFYRDVRLNHPTSTLLPFFFPLLGLLLSQLTFIEIISLTGSITIFVSALIICLMRLKLKSDYSVYFRIFLILSILFIGLLNEFI